MDHISYRCLSHELKLEIKMLLNCQTKWHACLEELLGALYGCVFVGVHQIEGQWLRFLVDKGMGTPI